MSENVDHSRHRPRPLLPAGGLTPSQVINLRNHPSLTSSSTAALPKRKPIIAACESCRKTKSKCNGGRPVCSKCASRGLECRYDTRDAETHPQALKRKHNELSDKVSVHLELFNLLQSLSHDDAQLMLKKIRSGVSAESIVGQVKDGDLLLQMALIPESRMRYDFPNISKIPSHLQIPSNPYLNSIIYQATLAPSTQCSCASSSSASPPPTSMIMDMKNSLESPFVKPYHAVELVDPQLEAATPSRWTKVSSDDKQLRRLLGKFFLHHYPRYAAFHKDYFLADMNSGRRDHCSSLLVNAVLAAACHSDLSIPDRQKYWEPYSLGYAFIAEARRLWELEAGQSKLTTIQASIVMHVTYILNGFDTLGLSYAFQAVSIANEMKLFTPSDPTDEVNYNARLFTAWSLYNWQSVLSYCSLQPPLMLLCPPPPPEVTKDASIYPELWIRYPMEPKLYPLNFGLTLHAVCNFRVIMNDISLELFTGRDPQKKIPWEHAMQYRTRLESWYKALPPELAPTSIILPVHFVLHMEYHNTIISMFSTKTQTDGEESPNIQSNERYDMAQQIIADAMIALETLFRLYYLHHSYEAYDPFMVIFMIMLANSTIEMLQKSENSLDRDTEQSILSTLILCLKGMYDQGKSYTLGKSLLRSFWSRLREQDQRLLQGYIHPDNSGLEESKDVDKEFKQQWIIPLAVWGDDPDGSRLMDLLTEYAHAPLQDKMMEIMTSHFENRLSTDLSEGDDIKSDQMSS